MPSSLSLIGLCQSYGTHNTSDLTSRPVNLQQNNKHEVYLKKQIFQQENMKLIFNLNQSYIPFLSKYW